MQESSTYKSLTILFYAFFAGMLVFAAIAFFLVSTGTMGDSSDTSLTSIMLLLAICAAVGGVFGGNLLYKRTVQQALTKADIKEKLETYKSAAVLKFALIEGPCLFAIIAYMLTGNVQFLYLIALLLIVFLLQKPSKDKMAIDLELNEVEKQML